MKFSTFLKKQTKSLITESIGIEDGRLVFNYKKLKHGEEEISSKFGKSNKKQKFVPYEKTTETIIKHKVFSVYGIKYNNDIVKAIKKQNDITASNEDYDKFINRTAEYINYMFIKKNNIQTVIVPMSSSALTDDVVEKLVEKNPNIKYIKNVFTKADISKIGIAKDHPKITPEIIEYIEKEIEKAKVNKFFAMKKIVPMFRKFITNIFELTPNISLRNHLDNKNVMLIDDIVTSGSSTADMIRSLELYAPAKLYLTTIFKLSS